MFKLFVFTILLITSSSFGLLDDLYQTENNCYSGCQSNYVDNLSNLDGCKKGCDYKFHNENCADQCKLFSIDEQIQASCLVGCSMSHSVHNKNRFTKIKQLIIFIRKHQLSNSDPVKIFKESNEHSKSKHTIIHQEDTFDYLLQFIKDIPSKSTQFICNQSNLSIWILLSIFILVSTILSYKIVLLCWKTPKHHNLSIRAEELIFEKEFIQPNLPIKIKITDA